MNPRHFVFDRNTTLSAPENSTSPVKNALGIFARDFTKVFGSPMRMDTADHARVRIEYDAAGALTDPESFSIRYGEADGNRLVMTLIGKDDLGIIYGLLHLSREVLGVDPFWFWADREPQSQTEIRLAAIDYLSPARRIRYRGWFVNDEVCLLGWTERYPPPREVWEPVFETLLRLGGNLVIAGTDLPREGDQNRLASEMGLYVTHHHAEPLGAEMFFRAYPDSDASFERNTDLFEGLWREAIERQKDQQVVWALGFRGQGDCPFWEQDPSYDTPGLRGALISRAIRHQYELVQQALAGAPCLTYLYGEIAELYRQGQIEVPPGVAKIWSDNGYGRMVSRRQHNHNLRIPSLPEPGDGGPHGIYYHATFHDLQASSHLTMLPVPTALLVDELSAAFAAGADEIVLVNCGNVRPHIFTLDVFAELWRTGHIDAASAPLDFARRYFGGAPERAASAITGFIDAAVVYGPHKDDRAGDEFYHHPTRSLIGHVLRGEIDRTAEDLIWATGNMSFARQADWFEEKCAPAAERFVALERECLEIAAELPEAEAVFFRDLLLFQTRFNRSGAEGLSFVCRSIDAFLDRRYPQAFVLASQALWAFEESRSALDESEHGKWQNFFKADWLTNVKMTLYSVQALRMFYRMFGDNPDYFLWHKEYLMPESEKKIYLENTHRNPPSDDDLARRLQTRFGM